MAFSKVSWHWQYSKFLGIAQENASFLPKFDRKNQLIETHHLRPILCPISFNWDPCFKAEIQHHKKSWLRHYTLRGLFWRTLCRTFQKSFLMLLVSLKINLNTRFFCSFQNRYKFIFFSKIKLKEIFFQILFLFSW